MSTIVDILKRFAPVSIKENIFPIQDYRYLCC